MHDWVKRPPAVFEAKQSNNSSLRSVLLKELRKFLWDQRQELYLYRFFTEKAYKTIQQTKVVFLDVDRALVLSTKKMIQQTSGMFQTMGQVLFNSASCSLDCLEWLRDWAFENSKRLREVWIYAERSIGACFQKEQGFYRLALEMSKKRLFLLRLAKRPKRKRIGWWCGSLSRFLKIGRKLSSRVVAKTTKIYYLYSKRCFFWIQATKI